MADQRVCEEREGTRTSAAAFGFLILFCNFSIFSISVFFKPFLCILSLSLCNFIFVVPIFSSSTFLLCCLYSIFFKQSFYFFNSFLFIFYLSICSCYIFSFPTLVLLVFQLFLFHIFQFHSFLLLSNLIFFPPCSTQFQVSLLTHFQLHRYFFTCFSFFFHLFIVYFHFKSLSLSSFYN